MNEVMNTPELAGANGESLLFDCDLVFSVRISFSDVSADNIISSIASRDLDIKEHFRNYLSQFSFFDVEDPECDFDTSYGYSFDGDSSLSSSLLRYHLTYFHRFKTYEEFSSFHAVVADSWADIKKYLVDYFGSQFSCVDVNKDISSNYSINISCH